MARPKGRCRDRGVLLRLRASDTRWPRCVLLNKGTLVSSKLMCRTTRSGGILRCKVLLHAHTAVAWYCDRRALRTKNGCRKMAPVVCGCLKDFHMWTQFWVQKMDPLFSSHVEARSGSEGRAVEILHASTELFRKRIVHGNTWRVYMEASESHGSRAWFKT